jgi:hypothetical protein
MKHNPAPSESLAGLLDFTPVRLRARVDGWTPERQRAYVAALARWGSGRLAAEHVGLTPQSAARLCRRPHAASFSAACQRAWTIGKIARRKRSAGDNLFFQGSTSTIYEPSSAPRAGRAARFSPQA